MNAGVLHTECVEGQGRSFARRRGAAADRDAGDAEFALRERDRETGVAHLDIAHATVEQARCRVADAKSADLERPARSEEHTSELQSLMRSSYAVFCLKKKKY